MKSIDTPRTNARLGVVVPVLVFALAMLAIAASRLTLTYDLGYFLPPPTTDAQRVLIERLGQGPGAQLIFAVLPDTKIEAAAKLAQKLREQPEVSRVLPEAMSPNIEQLPIAVWDNRLLLGDLPTTAKAWREILDERAMDAMIADDDLLELIAADPAFTSINALEKTTSATSQPVFESVSERGQERYLLIQTRGGAFDLDSQKQAVVAIRAALKQQGIPGAELYGSGVYGVDLQSSIQKESILFSALASVALAIAVFLRFRSFATLLLVGTPLLVGGATGLAALALVFDQVHGITLAFGFTLLGVAIDYPLHLFSHAQTQEKTGQPSAIWPTLFLGITSTLIAYVAFALSGNSGMQQLGVFATSGIAAAAACAYLLTFAAPAASAATAPAPNSPRKMTRPLKQRPLKQRLWFTCAVVSAFILVQKPLFSNNLSNMTPVPKATLEEDARLRSTMGVADLRYLISVRGSTQDKTLQQLEHTAATLDKLIDANLLASYQSITSLLPSKETQRRRQRRAATVLENGAFTSALANSEFDETAFEPFISALTQTATGREKPEQTALTLTAERLKAQSPELGSYLDALLYQAKQGNTVGLIFLRPTDGQTDTRALETAVIERALTDVPGAEFIDLKAASMSLVRDYRLRVFTLLGAALIAICGLLLLSTRNPRRVLWLIGTVGSALCISLAVGAWMFGGLSLFDVIALTLVAGLGLDYALFFSRDETSPTNANATEKAVTLCALSSLLVFGILAFSSVPLLKSLGVTVATGVFAAYALARWGRGSISQ